VALQDKKQDLLKPDNHQAQSAFSREICTDMVYPECQVEFIELAQALDDHGLDLYKEEE
jgi:hypothetical protein